MKINTQIQELVEEFSSGENKNFSINKKALSEDYNNNTNNESILIKIIAIIGGCIATSNLTGLFVLLGFEKGYPALISGLLFIAFAIFISRKNHKIVLNTLSICFFITGKVLLSIGFVTTSFKITTDENIAVTIQILSVIYIIISLLTIYFTKGYILIFLSVLLINSGIIALLTSNNYIIFSTESIGNKLLLFSCLISILLTFFINRENKLLNLFKLQTKKYEPIKLGLTISFIIILIFFSIVKVNYIWFISVINIALLIFTVSKILKSFNFNNLKVEFIIDVCIVVILGLTASNPAISGSFSLIVLGYYTNQKTTLVLGTLLGLYALIYFYYSLELTLLTKSLLLMGSGIVFLGLYLCIDKITSTNEIV